MARPSGSAAWSLVVLVLGGSLGFRVQGFRGLEFRV